jgi:hypothetical protein
MIGKIEWLKIALAFALAGTGAFAQSPGQTALIRKPVFDTPQIWKLTKSVTRQYWGRELFNNIEGMAKSYIASPGYQIYTLAGFYVDHGWDRMVYIEGMDDWIKAYGTMGRGTGNFSFPRDIDVIAPCDETGYSNFYNIYVSDRANDRIVKLRYDWHQKTILSDGAITGNGLHRVQDIDLCNNFDFWPGTNDYLWVLNLDGPLMRFTPDGVLHSTYGASGCPGGTGYFCHPSAIVAGKDPFLSAPHDRYANDNKIYVADTGNHRIVWLEKDTLSEEISWVKHIPISAGIVDLETDNFGQLWALDQAGGRVIKYTSDLYPLCTFGNSGIGQNQFLRPTTIANPGGYLGNGSIFVAESWSDSSGGQYYSIGTDILNYFINNSSNNHWHYIHYLLADPSSLSIKVINDQSQWIRTIKSGAEMSGESSYTWDGANDSGVQVPTGYYYVSVFDTSAYWYPGTGPVNAVTKGTWVFHAFNPAPNHIPGDVNGDAIVNVGDAIYLINYVFKSGPDPVPAVCAGDVNADSRVNVGDTIYLINFIFKSGPLPLEGC